MAEERIVLSGVTYVLFTHEPATFGDDSLVYDHVLDREIRLDFSDGTTKFVSWTNEPVVHCVGVKAESWFKPGDDVTVNVSGRDPWRHLIGHPIDLLWSDADHQVLEVCAGERSAFLCSREGSSWCADAITVSAGAPVLPSNPSLERP
ncbi:MAG: hypothetical protein U1F39_06470 [Steroidobacteraceae bacterium]